MKKRELKAEISRLRLEIADLKGTHIFDEYDFAPREDRFAEQYSDASLRLEAAGSDGMPIRWGFAPLPAIRRDVDADELALWGDKWKGLGAFEGVEMRSEPLDWDRYRLEGLWRFKPQRVRA